ncbi:hypothetical protein CP061683_1358A, partial [Chlamydia psittaci 06-1683]
MRFGGGG